MKENLKKIKEIVQCMCEKPNPIYTTEAGLMEGWGWKCMNCYTKYIRRNDESVESG